MKRVGILTREENLNNKEILYIPKNIYSSIKGKVEILLIPFTMDDTFSSIKNLVDEFDGIILPGGDDIYPLELELDNIVIYNVFSFNYIYCIGKVFVFIIIFNLFFVFWVDFPLTPIKLCKFEYFFFYSYLQVIHNVLFL